MTSNGTADLQSITHRFAGYPPWVGSHPRLSPGSSPSTGCAGCQGILEIQEDSVGMRERPVCTVGSFRGEILPMILAGLQLRGWTVQKALQIISRYGHIVMGSLTPGCIFPGIDRSTGQNRQRITA